LQKPKAVFFLSPSRAAQSVKPGPARPEMNAARGESLFLQEDFTFLIIEFCSSSRHASFSARRLSLFVIEMQMANKLSAGPTRNASFCVEKTHKTPFWLRARFD
jgi:hypothetical protein